MIYIYIFNFELDQSEVKIFNLHLLILNQLLHVQKLCLFFLLVYFYLFNDLIQKKKISILISLSLCSI
jgi:hypothetical protein